MDPLASWHHAVTGIPAKGLEVERRASDEERHAIAAALKILKLDALSASYRIDAIAGGGYRLHGSIDAGLEQACVVSLEPVRQTLADSFDVEFWPVLQSRDSDSDETILDCPDQELIENGVIPAGRIIFETISAALDPYPRRDGATFDFATRAPDLKGESPFAVLSALRPKR